MKHEIDFTIKEESVSEKMKGEYVMKRWISVLLVCCLIVSPISLRAKAATVNSGEFGEGLRWELDDEGVLTISGEGIIYMAEVPWTNYKNSINKVIIEEGITGVEANVFVGYEKLVSVVLPKTLVWMEATFASCPMLTSVEIPEGVQNIGDAAFQNCTSLQSITIPSTVTYVGIVAFGGCSNLTEVTFCHEADDILSASGTISEFKNSPVSTIYVVDKNNVHSSIQEAAGSSSETVVFKNISEKNVATKYTAGFSSQFDEVSVDDIVKVAIDLNHESDTIFNAGEIKVTYDAAKLTFDQQTSVLGTASVKNGEGSLILEDYGADKSVGNAVYTLAFTAKADGDAVITMTSAAFADSADAVKSDLIPASIAPASVTITINKKQFAVTLPEIFEGATTITDGENYTFRVVDGANYDYDTVTATMNGQSVDVIDNGDGTYTIENVTGELVIIGTRTEKSYVVTFEGNAAEDIADADETATYNTDYSFTMPKAEGWAYSLDSIMIGETAYTGYEVKDGVYTIAGTAIQGDIVISVSKVQTSAGVTVEGTGAGAAAGYETTVTLGEDYVLTIAPEAGYTYTVTATMGGETAEVVDNGDNSYTVKAVSGALVFTVDRTVIVSGVTVEEYLSSNNNKMWLVKNVTTVEEGKVPTYDGDPMFWSDEYNSYCYLVIAQTLSQEDAASNVDIVEGSAAEVDYDKDVNGTGKVDAADAQLVYDFYNAQYSEFTADVTMEKFLRADVNGVDGVTVEDAAAIISSLLN